MNLYIALPWLVCLIGLLMWLFIDPTKHPKAVEAGKMMFAIGLLAGLLTFPYGGASLSIGTGGGGRMR
jgi:hypothetical protein